MEFVLLVPMPLTTRMPSLLAMTRGTACQSFSCLLSTKLNTAYPATSSHQPILLVDLMSYFNLITGTTNTGSANTFGTYGVTNPDLVVCSTAVPSCTTSTLATTSTNQYTSTSWDLLDLCFCIQLLHNPICQSPDGRLHLQLQLLPRRLALIIFLIVQAS